MNSIKAKQSILKLQLIAVLAIIVLMFTQSTFGCTADSVILYPESIPGGRTNTVTDEFYVIPGGTVYFYGVATVTNPYHDTLEWQIDYGDGGGWETAVPVVYDPNDKYLTYPSTIPNLSHTYSTLGDKTVKIRSRLLDSAGNQLGNYVDDTCVVHVTALGVNIAWPDLAEEIGSPPTNEPHETDPGGFIVVNNNDSDSDGTIDLVDTNGVEDDDDCDPDLVAVTLNGSPSGAAYTGCTLKLTPTVTDRLKFYADKSKSTELTSLVWDLTTVTLPITVYVEGRSAGEVDLELSYDYLGGSVFTDEVKVTVVEVALKASNNVATETDATTEGDGTSSNPNTLLAGMHFVPPESWGIWESTHETVAAIDLSAYSDSAMTTQSFSSGDPTWTVSGPSGGNFEGNDLDDPREKTGADVTFYATTKGFYTFTAEQLDGAVSKSIDVYVAKTHINEYPEFLFAKATGRVPLGFEIQGIGTENFSIDTSGSSIFTWRARYWSESLEMYLDMTMDNDLDKDKFAPAWTDTSSNNGTSNSYKVVTNASPLVDAEMTSMSGLTEQVILSMICAGKVLLDGGEETNYAMIVSTKLDDVTGVKFVDKQWPVIEIGVDKNFSAAFAWARGKGYYEHIASDDNNYACSGFSNHPATFGTSGTFTAGGDEKYAAFNERHYHYGDTSETTGGPRGFDDEGAGDDIAIAGMTEDLDADGLTVESRLFDDVDLVSDDEEEYVAKALGAGISTHVFISYPLSDSTFFGEYYDTSTTTGNLLPTVLPDAKWSFDLGDGVAGGGSFSGIALSVIGITVGIATLCIASATPVGWVAWGLYAAGSLATAIGAAEAVNSFSAYGAQSSLARVAWYDRKYDWDSSTAGSEIGSIQASGTGSSVGATYNNRGIWAGDWSSGTVVNVGSQHRTSFEIYTSAQNESAETGRTNDVQGKVTLERATGSHDLRDVKYEWD
ncbi:MAG: hypothetical protein FVQ82_17365 [Planctomycetes bacterium]|nr:hypothetical protein [Planctomycetota bacterium]